MKQHWPCVPHEQFVQGIWGLAGSGLAEAIYKFCIKQTNAEAVLCAARDEARVVDLEIMVKELKPLSQPQAAFPCICRIVLCRRKGDAAGMALIRAWHMSLIETTHRIGHSSHVCDVGTQLLQCVRALTDLALAERDLELSQPAEKSGVDSLRQKDKINAQLFQHFPPFASYHKYQYKYRNTEVNSLPSLPFPYACISAVKGFM